MPSFHRFVEVMYAGKTVGNPIVQVHLDILVETLLIFLD
jgi:hypothetical protein